MTDIELKKAHNELVDALNKPVTSLTEIKRCSELAAKLSTDAVSPAAILWKINEQELLEHAFGQLNAAELNAYNAEFECKQRKRAVEELLATFAGTIELMPEATRASIRATYEPKLKKYDV